MNKRKTKFVRENFFSDVFDVVRLIPRGRVTTYGAIALYLGSSKSSRMVGWAMNASHKLTGIPAHRVVNRNGLLTGHMHFSTPTTMQKHCLMMLLERKRLPLSIMI